MKLPVNPSLFKTLANNNGNKIIIPIRDIFLKNHRISLLYRKLLVFE